MSATATVVSAELYLQGAGMSSGDEMKERLEANIAKAFLLEYNAARGSSFRIERTGQPAEPDRVCHDVRTGARIGLEISVAYYGRGHAKSVWDEFRGKVADTYHLRDELLETQKLLLFIRERLSEKSVKSYSNQYPIFLVIVSQPLRVRLTEIQGDLLTFRLPPVHPFSAIFLMNNVEGEVLQLFPEWQWVFPKNGRY